ncbi:unnamed protein product [Brachionus calyciflorus]|uniref:Pecanex-like protein n=1 Tax=Brachionus calyciflorus TaxID=104777 RepID=A0A813NVV2_9BILA|nr:unnamed protein product [Brachionus calyciflorus]
MSRNNQESTSSPFLNDYKRNFVFKRFLQTFIGGPILKFNSGIDVPAYIYIFQIGLFILPFIIGGISILIHDLTNAGKYGGPNSNYSLIYFSLAGGGIYFLIVFTLKIITISISNKTNNSNENFKGSKGPRLLSDEQNFEFTKLFSKKTLQFLVANSNEIFVDLSSKSKVKLKYLFLTLLRTLFDSIFAGYIMFCSIYFESIIYLQNFYALGPSIILFILHWIVLSMSLYSLCFRDPPEPSIYQPFSNAYIPINVIFYLKIFFSCLPVTWILGLLPPIDAFFLWLAEQSYIHLYGGTATATNLRLLFQLFISVIVSMTHFIPNDIAIVVIFSAFGYILSSIDLLFLNEWLICEIKIKKSKIAPVIETKNSIGEQKIKRKYPFNWKDCLYHLIMLILTITISVVIFTVFNAEFFSYEDPFLVETIMLYISIGIFIICKIFGDLQSVFLFFGLIRNPFYPKNSLSLNLSTKNPRTINQNKIFFRILKYIRLILLKIISPLVLCAVISIDCHLNKIYNDKIFGYWRTLVVLRAYRWIWQSSYYCLMEMCATHIFLFAISYNSVTESMTKVYLIRYFLTGCLAASFIRDRLSQMLNKLYAYILITITAWTIKKQRRSLALIFLVLNIVLILPTFIFVILPSCILSAPLLPLFTFPIFLFSFPRPKKFWPQKKNFFSKSIEINDVSSTSNTNKKPSSAEGFFYSQLVPDLVNSFKQHIRSGSIGQSIQADTFFLSRFQDRIIWIQVLESSNSFYVINIKGLELQETSCHTREAQYIDDLFELNFENSLGANSNSQSNKKILILNKKPFNCMSSKDILLLNAYSDARNSLVGILDYPENLEFLCQIYPKILHYFLVLFLFEKNKNFDPKLNEELNHLPPSVRNSKASLLSAKEKEPSFINSPEVKSIFEDTNELTIDSAISKKNIFLSKKKNDNIDSFDDWSDSDSDMEKNSKNNKNLKNSKLSTPSSKKKENTDYDPFDFDLNEILGNSSAGKKSATKKVEVKKEEKYLKNERLSPKNFKKSLEFQLPMSILSLPSEWVTFMSENLNSSQSLNSEELKKSLGTKKWLEKILGLNPRIKLDESEKLLNDYETNIWTSHYKFLLKCLQTLNLNEKTVNLNYNSEAINNFYRGDLPWSPANEKLMKNFKDLHSILIKSFRYAIKMTIDHATLSPISDDDEFFETLDSYEKEWFIGCENDEEFGRQINEKKPFLFSLQRDSLKKTLNSRNLSLQNIRSPMAKLNSEIVKSIWASTNLELLYMTNDDEERYSIQAHDYILRNLTIQSSDPPLGYPVYNSENVYISIANPFFE